MPLPNLVRMGNALGGNNSGIRIFRKARVPRRPFIVTIRLEMTGAVDFGVLFFPFTRYAVLFLYLINLEDLFFRTATSTRYGGKEMCFLTFVNE